MDYKVEIERRDKHIEACRKEIKSLNEEIIALRQLLDCAAANIVLLVKEHKTPLKLSKKEIRDALGKFHVHATNDDEGNYILELTEE